MYIEVDYRELHIIELLKKSNFTDYKVCNLINADFIIKDDENIFFVIERKSIKDLYSSIVDGRHADQKNRLLECINDNNKIIYIIEGSKEFNINKKSINSSILNLIFKHKYKVIFTESLVDTLDNLLLLYDKIKNDKLNIDTCSNVKIVKKSDKIKNNTFINMLIVIPGITEKTASKIEEEYKTFNELLISYNLLKNEREKKEMLMNISLNEKRKIGKKISEKVYNTFFFGNY